MFDLACGDEFLHSARDVLDGNRGVNSMLVQQVDGVGLQAFQRRLDDFPNVLRTAVQAAAALSGFRINVEAEFCRDHHLITKWCDRFTHKFFVCERAVCLCRIEECHASLEGCTDDLDTVLTRHRRTIGRRQSHATESQSRDFQSAFSQRALLHLLLLP